MVTGWTSWQFNDDFLQYMLDVDPDPSVTYSDLEPREQYIEFSEAISNLKKNMPKLLTKQDVEGKSEEEIKNIFNQRDKEWSEYDKNPFIEGKEAEGKSLIAYREKCCKDLFDFCVENRIYISPDEHQNSDWGVPIFDDKYVDQFSLRSWAGLMAEVWNKIMNRTDLTYLDFYCNDADKVIKDYKKPSEVM